MKVIPKIIVIEPLTEARFRSLSRRMQNGCWEWAGSIRPDGYGDLYALCADGVRRSVRAHRFSYVLAHGVNPIKHIDHLCRNRACVNPDHLEAVEPVENMERGVGPIGATLSAWAEGRCPNGHDLAAGGMRIEKRGFRRCAECARAASRESERRRRLKRAASQRQEDTAA